MNAFLQLVPVSLLSSIFVLFVAFSFLPNAVDHPVPQELYDSLDYIFDALWTMNIIFPMDTFFTVVWYGIVMWISSFILWPFVLWLVRTISGGGQ